MAYDFLMILYPIAALQYIAQYVQQYLQLIM